MPVNPVGGRAAGAVRNPNELSKAEQDMILKMIRAEQKMAAPPAAAMRSMATRSAGGASADAPRAPIAMRYGIIRPPVPPQPGPVWAGPEAYQALCNKITDGPGVMKSELKLVKLLAKMLNNDIAKAAAGGNDIRPDIRKWLQTLAETVKIDPKIAGQVKDIMFAKGGPGYQERVSNDNPPPIYVIGPNGQHHPDSGQPQPIYVIGPRGPRRGSE